MFLLMLDIDGNELLHLTMTVYVTNDGIDTDFDYRRDWKELENNGKDLHAFSQEWIKGCAAFNRSSGLYQIVVDGVLVANKTRPPSFMANIPTDLGGKIVLGGRQFAVPGGWMPSKNKVTNLNIFSTAH